MTDEQVNQFCEDFRSLLEKKSGRIAYVDIDYDMIVEMATDCLPSPAE